MSIGIGWFKQAEDAILDAATNKPAFGAPCNGCGYCCLAEQCPVSVNVFGGAHVVCPALEVADGMYRCGLLTNTQKYAPDRVAKFGLDRALRWLRLLMITDRCDTKAAGSLRNAAAEKRLDEQKARINIRDYFNAYGAWLA